MKKLFIGLLIIAAGAGTFYFLQKKKTETGNDIQKDLLAGKWKLDSLDVRARDSAAYFIAGVEVLDPVFPRLCFDFRKDGNILVSLADSVRPDTSRYEWTKKNELFLKGNIHDSTGELYTVTRLTNDKLSLQSKVSDVFVLAKMK